MKVTAKIKLDLRSQNYGSSVYAVQGDGGSRCVEAALLDGGKPWNVPAGVTAAVAYKKPDFTKGLYDKLADDTPAVTVSGSTVTVVLAKQMLTVPGSVQACIVFNNAALDQLTTFPFTVAVAANPVIGAEPSDDYIRLQWLEDKLEEYWSPAREQIELAVKGADDAAAAANRSAQAANTAAWNAQAVANTVNGDVNQLKKDLTDLAPAGAAVGQLFRVAAVSNDGKYTMEPVDMLDVRVNGESIVQDGIAIIPLANGLGKSGIVRLAANLGVKWSNASGGGLSIDYASIGDISSRGSSNKPIIPYYLDYAVKAAMCDGKGAAWTDVERIAALLRMGCTVDDNGFVKWASQEVSE